MTQPEVSVVVTAIDEGVDAAVEDGREEHPVSDHLRDLNQWSIETLNTWYYLSGRVSVNKFPKMKINHVNLKDGKRYLFLSRAHGR